MKYLRKRKRNMNFSQGVLTHIPRFAVNVHDIVLHTFGNFEEAKILAEKSLSFTKQYQTLAEFGYGYRTCVRFGRVQSEGEGKTYNTDILKIAFDTWKKDKLLPL